MEAAGDKALGHISTMLCFWYGLLTRKEHSENVLGGGDNYFYLNHKAFSCGIYSPGVLKQPSCISVAFYDKIAILSLLGLAFNTDTSCNPFFLSCSCFCRVWRRVLKYIGP